MSALSLSASLQGHKADVRSLSTNKKMILSSSRDATAIAWTQASTSNAGLGAPSPSSSWQQSKVIKEQEGKFVSCVTTVDYDGETLIAIGSQSGMVAAYPVNSRDEDPKYMLIGHKENTCCIDAGADGMLVTGSWDKTAIIWKDWTAVRTIETHKQAIWAVKFVGANQILTASADASILLHSFNGDLIQKFSGHTQPVRSLSLTPDANGFWSGGNDGLINLYDVGSSAPRMSLSGHTSFVYSVAALVDGSGVVSSGEDGTMRVWKDGREVQTISHPTLSVWAVAVLENGDVVSGASDGLVRVWTADKSRFAAQAERSAFDQAVSARQLNTTQIGDVKKSDLPGIEALGRAGKKEGEVLMIKHEDKVQAYQWSSNETTWVQIGEVVDAVGSGRKQLYEGKEYDYVFDVDVQEGVPPLKLPYNISENPWAAAQRFLARNDLPQTYSDEVVRFIEKNTEGVKIGEPQAAYVDPYTGASSYRGAGNAAAAGGSTYRDPFTGGGAYSTTPAAPAAVQKKGILPVKMPLFFKQSNIPAAKTKLAQLNDEFKTSPEGGGYAYDAEEEKTLSEVFALLSLPGPALPDPKAENPTERWDSKLFFSILTRWPVEKRFPLIDLARVLAAASPAFAAHSSASGMDTIDLLFLACDYTEPWQTSKARETNTMLALRAIANLFATANGRKILANKAGDVCGQLTRHDWMSLGKNIRIAAATILLNFSTMAVATRYPTEHGPVLLQTISSILESESEDGEVAYRATVALGNLISASSVNGSLQVGELQRAKQVASALSQKLKEQRLKDVVTEIESLFA